MKRILIFSVVAFAMGILGVALPQSSRADSPVIPQKVTLLSEESSERQYCPSCGGLPEFTFLRDNGVCWLVCHDCGTEWSFQRIKCAYCSNQTPDTLAYFYADNKGMPPCRFYVCKVCQKYIKTADLRSAQSAVLTILQTSMVSQLEWEVQNLGYEPGWAK